RSVFNFCAKRGLMQQKSNPIGKLDFVAMPRHMVQIFPVDTVQALLNDALENDLAFLPYRVLNFFAGIRPEGELSRLQWSDVRIAERKVVLPAAITKKKKERHISLSDNAIEWLTEYQARGGSTTGLVAPFSATTLRRKHRRNYRAAGITKWIQSGGRHSYCSYWLQKFKDPDLLTLQSGHDDADTLWKSYYQGGSESEADRYWNIRPPTPATNIVPMAKAS
ncbi:MAG TPA: site-specific integrase, partial [Chthoniobacterales bacterium]|nr:site-specific integrase [Chthoniobacterales bacterium]